MKETSPTEVVEPEKPEKKATKKKEAKKELVVVEFLGEDEEALFAELDAALESVKPGGRLLITVGKFDIPREQVDTFLTGRSTQPLNVGTSPHLDDTNVRRRVGWIVNC